MPGSFGVRAGGGRVVGQTGRSVMYGAYTAASGSEADRALLRRRLRALSEAHRTDTADTIDTKPAAPPFARILSIVSAVSQPRAATFVALNRVRNAGRLRPVPPSHPLAVGEGDKRRRRCRRRRLSGHRTLRASGNQKSAPRGRHRALRGLPRRGGDVALGGRTNPAGRGLRKHHPKLDQAVTDGSYACGIRLGLADVSPRSVKERTR
jgi:hypothetical protein